VKEQEKSTESLQMQPEEEIQAKSSEGEPQEKEEQNQELVQTKLTVGAPGDKYEQEADSMAAKVMTMPDSAIQQPIQRQTGEDTEAVQMQPLVNSISPLVQRESGEEEEVQMKSGANEHLMGVLWRVPVSKAASPVLRVEAALYPIMYAVSWSRALGQILATSKCIPTRMRCR
jgi:hypothetical protein